MSIKRTTVREGTEQGNMVNYKDFDASKIIFGTPEKRSLPDDADTTGDFHVIPILYDYGEFGKRRFQLEGPRVKSPSGIKVQVKKPKKGEPPIDPPIIIGKNLSVILDKKNPEHIAFMKVLDDLYIKCAGTMIKKMTKALIPGLAHAILPSIEDLINPTVRWKELSHPLFYGMPIDPKMNPYLTGKLYGGKQEPGKATSGGSIFVKRTRICVICNTTTCKSPTHKKEPEKYPQDIINSSGLDIVPLYSFQDIFYSSQTQKKLRFNLKSAVVYDFFGKEQSFDQQSALDEAGNNTEDIELMEEKIRMAEQQFSSAKTQEPTPQKKTVEEVVEERKKGEIEPDNDVTDI